MRCNGERRDFLTHLPLIGKLKLFAFFPIHQHAYQAALIHLHDPFGIGVLGSLPFQKTPGKACRVSIHFHTQMDVLVIQFIGFLIGKFHEGTQITRGKLIIKQQGFQGLGGGFGKIGRKLSGG